MKIDSLSNEKEIWMQEIRDMDNRALVNALKNGVETVTFFAIAKRDIDYAKFLDQIEQIKAEILNRLEKK